MFGISRPYSLHKSRTILAHVNYWYTRNWQELRSEDLAPLEAKLRDLDQAILNRERKAANVLARELESFGKEHVKKSFFEYVKELAIAIVFALVIATVVRQVWFELYQIPTGSMRPTYREKDHLVVSKTTFGLNVPLQAKQFYFDPEEVKRTGVTVCTGHNLDLQGTDDRYFWIYPYKKRYIKRLIAKPGDSIYFYGGKLYGVDSEGAPITELLDAPAMAKLEHIPFNSFEGRIEAKSGADGMAWEMRHWNQPLAEFSMHSKNGLQGKSLHGEEFSTAYGIENFAMARLLTAEEVQRFTKHSLDPANKAPLYLELRHHPQLQESQLLMDSRGGMHLQLAAENSLIPLQQEHLDNLRATLYTNRFIVKDGIAIRYDVGGLPNAWHRPPMNSMLPRLPGVPDGMYEFYYGKAVELGFKGWPHDLEANHPLYSADPALTQKLFNYGIQINRSVQASDRVQQNWPSRYVYWRDGALYAMGGEILAKDDPVLLDFADAEKKRASTSGYQAFLDAGAPLLANGDLDLEKLRSEGVTVPEGHYMLLGDNHAFSADSRWFGFVPAANLRGTPQLIVWPPGERWGVADKPPGSNWNFPTILIWGLCLGGFLIWYAYRRTQMQKPVFQKISP